MARDYDYVKNTQNALLSTLFVKCARKIKTRQTNKTKQQQRIGGLFCVCKLNC